MTQRQTHKEKGREENRKEETEEKEMNREKKIGRSVEGVAVKRVTDDKLQGSFMLKINIFELFQLSFIFLLFYFSLISVTADIFSVFSKNIHLFVSFD